MKFKVCIADEAHYLKSRDAKRSKALIPIYQQSKRVILLSGTPMINRPVEMYNLLLILRPDIISNFTAFAYRYCAPKETPYGMVYDGSCNTKELHRILSSSVMIRRLKKDVLNELPDKRRQKIEVQTDQKLVNQVKKILASSPMDNEELEKYDTSCFDDYTDMLKQKQVKEKEDNSFMQAYRLSGESKLGGICDFLDTLLENQCKFLVFAHHQSVMNGLENFMKGLKQKVQYIRIDGSTNLELRHERV